MLIQCRNVFGIGGVYHIEEVSSVWQVASGLLLGEELCEIRLLHNLVYKIDDTDFIVLGNFDRSQLAIGDQALLTGKHLLNEVLGELLLGREVELS